MLSQVPTGIAWEPIAQIGVSATVALVLLYHVLASHKDQAKTVRAVAITHITIQKMLMVLIYTHRHIAADGGNAEECKRLAESVEDIKKVLEVQQDELRRVFEK